MGWGVYDYPEPKGKELILPECPICGEECETFYMDRRENIVGCEHCITTEGSYMETDWEE